MSEDIEHDGQGLAAAGGLHEEFARNLIRSANLIQTTLYNVDYAPGATDKESLESVKKSRETLEIPAQILAAVGQISGVQGEAFDDFRKLGGATEDINTSKSDWTQEGSTQGGSHH